MPVPAEPSRFADVSLRSPAPRTPARLHWPDRTDPPPALVVLFTARPQPVGELVGELVGRLGAIALVVCAAHAVEAHAATGWAADHAVELGADPHRLVLVGDGAGAALAERVAELAADEGWPPIRHVLSIWPHDDRAAAVAELARVLDGPARSGR